MTQTQKKFLLIGFLALIPAYLFSDWRHAESTATISATRERENQMRESDQKLLNVCKETGLGEGGNFTSNDVLCRQAQERQKLQLNLFQKLEEDQHRTDRDRYWNFVWVWLMINAAAQMFMRWVAIQKKMGD
jgi:hypothetical protein